MRVRVLIGWGLDVAGSGDKEGCGVEVIVGRSVEVIVDDGLGVDVCEDNGLVAKALFSG